MTKAEREQAAIERHVCPRCHTPALNRCRSTDARRSVMKHPHPERVKLVPEPTPMNTIKAGDEKPCLVCGQPREAHRKPGTAELRCPEPEPKET